MSLVVYNTMARTKEPFVPLEPGKVRMYVCGPTVYDSCHLGHARHAVVWDVIRRYLEYSGYSVIFVTNVTDVDDKIIERANSEEVGWQQIASRYAVEYFRDMADLGVRRPTHQPRATEHLRNMIAAIERLVGTRHAYVADGNVFYSVERFADYGKLSGRRSDDGAVSRVETDARKRDPADFALWKASKPGEPSWGSPWGPGRPGWHIECSVMSADYLGTPFDIHAGGQDLVFPHHENEIAQSEALTGTPLARYWLHNGFITVRSEKMAKSLGNVVGLRDLLDRHTGSVLRFYFLGAHYRRPVEFSQEHLLEAAAGFDRIFNCLEAVDRRVSTEGGIPGHREELSASIETARARFAQAMDDDFNTSAALGAVFGLVSAVNSSLASDRSAPAADGAASVIRELLGVLGLPPERERRRPAEHESGLVELLLSVRDEARRAKQFTLSDSIRRGLARLGARIEDLPGGNTRLVWEAPRRQADGGAALEGETDR